MNISPEMGSVGKSRVLINSAKVMSAIPIWAIHSRIGFGDPCGSLPTILCKNSVILSIWDQLQLKHIGQTPALS